MPTDFSHLKEYCKTQKLKLILVSDAEPVVSVKKDGGFGTYIPAGGVAVALEPLARASSCMYIARGKTQEDKQSVGLSGTLQIKTDDSTYQLKRIFLSDQEMDGYYFGFSNQTLWPMMHVTFESPLFHSNWYEEYRKVNKKFARAIQDEIGKDTVIWINDYQLALVPSFLRPEKDTLLGFFWHIPWPTWEVFRILPEKKEILESLLKCDYIAFHRGYHVRNFLQTVERELEARIDQETNRIFYKNHVTTVDNLPMGIDVDVVRRLSQKPISEQKKKGLVKRILQRIFKEKEKPLPQKELPAQYLFKKYRVILGVDRLDYTKGLIHRMESLERFFQDNPRYIGKVVYLGILAPSREKIPAYQTLKRDLSALAKKINKRFQTPTWKPINLFTSILSRQTLIQLYKEAELCLVTPLDDGMNLVSKEYVMASSLNEKPGMIILSQFAGSAIDLTEGIIVNPYNANEVATAIVTGLSLSEKEKRNRMHMMAKTLEERNVYSWSEAFLTNAKDSGRQNRKK